MPHIKAIYSSVMMLIIPVPSTDDLLEKKCQRSANEKCEMKGSYMFTFLLKFQFKTLGKSPIHFEDKVLNSIDFSRDQIMWSENLIIFSLKVVSIFPISSRYIRDDKIKIVNSRIIL